jgi:hypothetical protein
MSFTADVKLHVPTRSRLEPFFQGGLGFAILGANYPANYNYDKVFASGLAFNVGGGLEFFAGSWISIGGRLLYRGFRFGEPSATAGGIPRYTNFVNGMSLDFFGTIHF